ncbi:MAG: hypothetical protein JSU98_07550 [Gemmatimonadales bacterium]|jgi:hypothetical protein|nr:MAG: hypothetical protein JSU98_07550 [Gemmatimonadales bacterium]
MQALSHERTLPNPFGWLKGPEGLAGRLALSWSIAGGLSMVAMLVLAAFLSGSPESAYVPFTVSVYFLVGAAGGFIHGALVGAAGRPPSVSISAAVRGLEAAGLWAIPGLAAAWVAGLWVSMTGMAASEAAPPLIATIVGGWLILAVAAGWALAEAAEGLRYAMQRWPERRPGRVLVLLTFATLLIVFLWQRPEIWFTDLRVSAVGAIILAFGATVWIALPVLVLALHFLHQWSAESPVWEGPHALQGEDAVG